MSAQHPEERIVEYRHVGAYGLLDNEGGILLVRKMRGPYRDYLDLPGGGIEFGEDPVAALCREFVEETGLIVTEHALVAALSNRVRYPIDSGEIEDLHHLGFIYRVAVAGRDGLRTEPDGEDAGGAVWIPLEELGMYALTPFVEAAVAMPVGATRIIGVEQS